MIEVCCEYLSVRLTWLYLIIMSTKSFRVNPHSIVPLNVKEVLSRSRCHIWSLSDSNKIPIPNQLVSKQTVNDLSKLEEWLSCVASSYLQSVLDCMLFSFHVRVCLHPTVCLNVRELLAWSRHHIWSLSDSNEIRIHNHLVRKPTLSYLAKLGKWMSRVVRTNLHGAFDCIFFSCHPRVSSWIQIF